MIIVVLLSIVVMVLGGWQFHLFLLSVTSFVLFLKDSLTSSMKTARALNSIVFVPLLQGTKSEAFADSNQIFWLLC